MIQWGDGRAGIGAGIGVRPIWPALGSASGSAGIGLRPIWPASGSAGIVEHRGASGSWSIGVMEHRGLEHRGQTDLEFFLE